MENVEASESPPGSTPTTRRFMRSISAGDLQALNSAQWGIISSIRHIKLDEAVSADNVKRLVAEIFPPSVLFSQDIRDLPALYSEIRDFLDSRRANMVQHSSRRVMMTLTTNLYEEPEDTVAATEIVQDIISAGRRRGNQSATTTIPLHTASA